MGPSVSSPPSFFDGLTGNTTAVSVLGTAVAAAVPTVRIATSKKVHKEDARLSPRSPIPIVTTLLQSKV